MIDPLSGFDVGPDDVFYDAPQRPIINAQGQSAPQNHPIHQVPIGGSDLAARVARLEQQVQRLTEMAGLG